MFGDGSQSGSEAHLFDDAPGASGIAIAGITSAATTSQTIHDVEVIGDPGESVQLLRVARRLYADSGTLFDPDPFAANNAVAVEYFDAVTLDGSGAATIPGTLTRADSDAGLNHLIVVQPDGNDQPVAVSDVIVLQLGNGRSRYSRAAERPCFLLPSPRWGSGLRVGCEAGGHMSETASVSRLLRTPDIPGAGRCMVAGGCRRPADSSMSRDSGGIL